MSDNLERVVSVRFTAAEVGQLQALAGGQPISRFIRTRALEDARTSIGPCELCGQPITGREYRSRHITEQTWQSAWHVDRWAYAHESCYQAARASDLGGVQS